MGAHDKVGHPLRLASLLALVTAGIVAALVASEESGTGAVDVGDRAPVPAAAAPPSPVASAAPVEPVPSPTPAPVRRCEPTSSNPGGTNNYIPDAPFVDSLGSGFVVRGRVRAARGCRPLEGVRVQVWLATETGAEQDNRASVRTDADGRYSIETSPTIAQFGEPNIHVGYDDGEYRSVFIRRVVDPDDNRASVNLTLSRG